MQFVLFGLCRWRPKGERDIPRMTDDFVRRLDRLPKAQWGLWDEVAAVPPEFVLYGGTAIALHLGHRRWVDFDFFGDRPFDPVKPYDTTATKLAAGVLTSRGANVAELKAWFSKQGDVQRAV